MYRATIIGHFAFGLQCLDGQTIKTNTIYNILQECIGNDSIRAIDTHGTIKFLLTLPFILFSVLRSTKNVIILPAQRGIKIISPLLLLLNIFFQRNIHYVVIGGWLPQMVKDCKLVKFFVQNSSDVFVVDGSRYFELIKSRTEVLKISANSFESSFAIFCFAM